MPRPSPAGRGSSAPPGTRTRRTRRGTGSAPRPGRARSRTPRAATGAARAPRAAWAGPGRPSPLRCPICGCCCRAMGRSRIWSRGRRRPSRRRRAARSAAFPRAPTRTSWSICCACCRWRPAPTRGRRARPCVACSSASWRGSRRSSRPPSCARRPPCSCRRSGTSSRGGAIRPGTSSPPTPRRRPSRGRIRTTTISRSSTAWGPPTSIRAAPSASRRRTRPTSSPRTGSSTSRASSRTRGSPSRCPNGETSWPIASWMRSGRAPRTSRPRASSRTSSSCWPFPSPSPTSTCSRASRASPS